MSSDLTAHDAFAPARTAAILTQAPNRFRKQARQWRPVTTPRPPCHLPPPSPTAFLHTLRTPHRCSLAPPPPRATRRTLLDMRLIAHTTIILTHLRRLTTCIRHLSTETFRCKGRRHISGCLRQHGLLPTSRIIRPSTEVLPPTCRSSSFPHRRFRPVQLQNGITHRSSMCTSAHGTTSCPRRPRPRPRTSLTRMLAPGDSRSNPTIASLRITAKEAAKEKAETLFLLSHRTSLTRFPWPHRPPCHPSTPSRRSSREQQPHRSSRLAPPTLRPTAKQARTLRIAPKRKMVMPLLLDERQPQSMPSTRLGSSMLRLPAYIRKQFAVRRHRHLQPLRRLAKNLCSTTRRPSPIPRSCWPN